MARGVAERRVHRVDIRIPYGVAVVLRARGWRIRRERAGRSVGGHGVVIVSQAGVVRRVPGDVAPELNPHRLQALCSIPATAEEVAQETWLKVSRETLERRLVLGNSLIPWDK